MSSRGSTGPATNVLCIDDRPHVLELRKAVLESGGYHVETVTSGYAAIKTLQATAIDAVLLEYKHQGIDAEAIACQIHRRFPNIPIVLVSAYFQMPERILWLVDAYVMKSEVLEGLVHAVQKVTRRSNTEALRARQMPAA
jgi:two-component system, NtrC family, response regulator GlrR